MLNDSLIRYHASLAPTPPGWGGLGATRLSLDPRDRGVLEYPGVMQVFPSLPDTASLVGQVKGSPYDQGGTGACVAASSAGDCSVDTGRATWETFDWRRLYSEAGGTGQNGVDSRLVLSNCVNLGTPRLDGSREKVIASYAFVTQQPGQFRQEIKACIAAGQPVVVALLLPSDFGWQSGHGAVTSGYHQVVGIAYDPLYLWIWNSWGASWPGNSPGPGIGSIAWEYLEAGGMQHNYCYSYTTSSLPLPSPTPTPLPTPTPTPTPTPAPIPAPVGVTLIGTASGTNIQTIGVGQTYNLTGGLVSGQLTVTQINGGPGPTPLPTPTPTPTPLPTPLPTPTPTPGDVQIQAQVFRGLYLMATATAGGQFVDAQMTATINSVPLGNRETVPLGPGARPAVWALTGRPPIGSPLTVTATAADGRTGAWTGST